MVQGQFDLPSGVLVDNKNVYVGEWSGNRIQISDKNGVFVCKWGKEGSGNGQFSRRKQWYFREHQF